MTTMCMDIGYVDIIRRARELNIQVKLLDGVETSTETVMVDRDNFDVLITDNDLRQKVKKLFCDGHHARAVEEAFKYLDNTVSRVAKLKKLTGSALMKKAFSANDPIIKLNSGISESEQNEQLGYMEIFSGVMTGIRNPRAHDSDWEDTEERALQLLIIANHLIGKVKATLTNG